MLKSHLANHLIPTRSQYKVLEDYASSKEKICLLFSNRCCRYFLGNTSRTVAERGLGKLSHKVYRSTLESVLKEEHNNLNNFNNCKTYETSLKRQVNKIQSLKSEKSRAKLINYTLPFNGTPGSKIETEQEKLLSGLARKMKLGSKIKDEMGKRDLKGEVNALQVLAFADQIGSKPKMRQKKQDPCGLLSMKLKDSEFEGKLVKNIVTTIVESKEFKLDGCKFQKMVKRALNPKDTNLLK